MSDISEIVPEVISVATNLADLPQGEINKKNMEGLLESLIGEYGWLLLIAVVTIMAKDMIINFAQGILVFMGNNFIDFFWTQRTANGKNRY